jgi:hypothetical protein
MVCLVTKGGDLKFKRFRLGRILNAEITSKQMQFADLNKAAYPQKYKKTAFAAITVQLDPKRSISKYDFVLKASGKEYPCVAIRKDNGVEKWKFEKTDPDSLYTLFFMVDGSGRPSSFELNYKLSHRGHLKVNLEFKDIGSRDLTPAKKVSRKGML